MALLSVIVPNYNHATLLPIACRAIFCQSRAPLEVILIDDASTDHSLEVIAQLQKKYPTIRAICNEKNIGPVLTIKRGIELSRGDYLAFCSADDYILPGFFEKGLALLEQNPSLGLCSGQATHFRADDPKNLVLEKVPLPAEARCFTPQVIEKLFRVSTYFIHTNCSLYRKQCVVELGGLNPKLLSISDWYLTCQIALCYGGGYIPRPFGAFRCAPDSYAQRLKRSPLRKEMFQNLMAEIERGGADWKRCVRRSGLIAQAGFWAVLALATSPQHWRYLPKAFLKKWAFFFRARSTGDDLPAAADLGSTS